MFALHVTSFGLGTLGRVLTRRRMAPGLGISAEIPEDGWKRAARCQPQGCPLVRGASCTLQKKQIWCSRPSTGEGTHTHTFQHGVLGSFGVTQVLSLLLSPSPDHYTAGGNRVKPTSQGTPELGERTRHPWGHWCLGWGEGSTPGGCGGNTTYNRIPRLRHRPASIMGNAPASSPPTPASRRCRSGSDIGFGTGASPAHANARRSENPPIPPKGDVGHLPPTRLVPQCCSMGAQPFARG